MFLAWIIVSVFLLYLALGVVFAVAFSMRGAAMIDPGARNPTLGFRFMIVPGVAALWPYLLYRWVMVAREEQIGSRGRKQGFELRDPVSKGGGEQR